MKGGPKVLPSSMSTGVQTSAAVKSSSERRGRPRRRMPAVTKVGTRLAGMKRELTITSMPRGEPNQPAMRSISCSFTIHLSGARRSAPRPSQRPSEYSTMSPMKIPTVQASAAHQKPMMPSAARRPAARQVGSSATKVQRMMIRRRIQKRAPSEATRCG